MTEVVAALIRRGEKFLICRRPPNKARGSMWEFVGGKVETGETHEIALRRECREELGIEISVGERFMNVIHEYPDITVNLTLYFAEIVLGEPYLYEHTEMEWIDKTQIDEFDFCPADEEILKKIKREF